MGNNLVHINAEKYYQSNLTNLILAREEVFLNIFYRENKILNDKNNANEKDDKNKKHQDNSKKNHEILKNFNKEAQIQYINNHKISGKLKRYIKTTFFYNFNIPEIQEIVNEKIKSKNLFDDSKENIKSLNDFGLKLFNIVKKYINSVVPKELKFISEEPLFYYFINQLNRSLVEGDIIYTIYDFVCLGDLSEKEISELFNVKSDTNLKEQIKEIKNLKKKYFNVIKKYYDIENNKSNKYLNIFIIISSIIILFTAVFIYKVIK